VNYTTTEIINFLAELSGNDKIKPESDIFLDIRMVGDDFHEMIEKYARQFSVDMKNYRWYFHCDEEGSGIGGFFFTPPYRRVKRIPVTPAMLTEFANSGKWEIDYPPYQLPKRRYDLWINRLIIGMLLAVIIWIVIRWITG